MTAPLPARPLPLQRDAIEAGYVAWMANETGRVEADVKAAEDKADAQAAARAAK